jgi:hypothetical protein
MKLHYDLPDDGDRPQYTLRFEFDEREQRFYAADDSTDGEGAWTEIGDWRHTSLWLARQLLAISVPVIRGTTFEVKGGPDDGAQVLEPIGSPSSVTRDLTDDEILRLLAAVE